MILTLKDGSTKEYPNDFTCQQVALDISEGLARVAICAKIDGKLVDMTYTPNTDCTFEVITFASEEGKEVYRHTASHVLANAVKNIFPTCKLAIGPAISNGYYYDFDFKTSITLADFDKIEEEMNKIIKANLPIERIEVSKEDAIKEFKKAGEIYKMELVEAIPEGEKVTMYKMGNFADLCRGPHLSSTGKIKAIKLTQLAGAYWRGDEKNKMLTRIYGTAFDKKSELNAYLEALEQAKRMDHNKLGRELGYFMTDENIGQGLPLLMPKGAKLFQVLTRFVEDEEQKRGYQLTKTPYMAKSDLYKMSGHWSHYKDKMFVLGDEEKDEEVLALRPMTCPFQFTIYKNGLKSYRDLPQRYAETATLFRKEASGEMHGLIRIRQFTLSDGHIVCMPSQVEEEFRACLDISYFMLDVLGLRDQVTFRFSKWDENDREKYIDDKEAWENTQRLMKGILDHIGLDYVEADGEAAFYGPKLDVQCKNVYGKEDTIFTIQIDFALADRFDMSYIDADGVKKTPYIIHRSSIGCYERTIAMLIEKYGGALPIWMMPTQVCVMSLTDRTASKATEVCNKLIAMGFRAETDNRSEKIGYKIREAQLEKTPYMIVIGDKEAESGLLSVRTRKEGEQANMTFEQFAEKLADDVKNFR